MSTRQSQNEIVSNQKRNQFAIVYSSSKRKAPRTKFCCLTTRRPIYCDR